MKRRIVIILWLALASLLSFGQSGNNFPPALPGLSAANFSGVDIFDRANNAAFAIQRGIQGPASGTVFIPPGTYSVATTLNGVDNVTFSAYGVTINYTGTGTAIKIANVGHGGIKGIRLNGPGTGGSTIAIQLGIGSGGLGADTPYNAIDDIYITNFNKGFVLEGSTLNGTYSNIIKAINISGCNKNFYLVPTVSNFANDNVFVQANAVAAISDGWTIDGANGTMCYGCRSEASGGWGFNLTGLSNTFSVTFSGVWGEGNASGDFNCGSISNVNGFTVNGGLLVSTPNFSANCKGPGNQLNTPSRWDSYSGNVSPFGFHWGSGVGANFAWALVNEEGSPSFSNVLAINRTGAGSGAGAGNLFMGSSEYPVQIRSFLSFNSNCQLGGATGTASPAACGAAPTGMIAIPASQTTYTVNTTAVTANSEIFVEQTSDNSGLPSSPTCSGTASNPLRSARVAATSFTFTLTSVAAVTCYHYWVVN